MLLADIIKNPIPPRGRLTASFNQHTRTVAANQNIRQGDFVALDGSGNLIQAIALNAANNTATDSGGNALIYGQAAKSIVTDATGVEAVSGRTTIEVNVGDINIEWPLNVYDATAGNATPAAFAVGTAYRLARLRLGSASLWRYVLVAGTNGEFVVTSPHPGDPSTETYGRVYVRPAVAEATLVG